MLKAESLKDVFMESVVSMEKLNTLNIFRSVNIRLGVSVAMTTDLLLNSEVSSFQGLLSTQMRLTKSPEVPTIQRRPYIGFNLSTGSTLVMVTG